LGCNGLVGLEILLQTTRTQKGLYFSYHKLFTFRTKLGECWGLGGLFLVQLEIIQTNKRVMLESRGMGLQLIMPIKGGFLLAD